MLPPQRWSCVCRRPMRTSVSLLVTETTACARSRGSSSASSRSALSRSRSMSSSSRPTTGTSSQPRRPASDLAAISAARPSAEPSIPTTILRGLDGPQPGRAISTEQGASCSASMSWPPKVSADRRRCRRTPTAIRVAPMRADSSQSRAVRRPETRCASSGSTSARARARALSTCRRRRAPRRCALPRRHELRGRFRRPQAARDGRSARRASSPARPRRGSQEFLSMPTRTRSKSESPGVARGPEAESVTAYLRRIGGTSFVGLSPPKVGRSTGPSTPE